MGRMVKVNVTDYVDHVYSNEDGMVIYNEIKKHLSSSNKVAVSFKGIGALNSSFINSAFVELLKDYDFNFIKGNIHFVDSTNQINNMIKSRFLSEVK